MPLVRSVLKAQIIEAQESASKATSEANAKEIFAEKLSLAIDAYIKAGDVSTVVTTAGTATAQTGTGTGKIT